MLSPRQSCTDFMPGLEVDAERLAAGSVFSSEVLPTPLGPKIAIGGLAARLGEPLVGGDDAEAHQRASPSTSRNVDLPVFRSPR